MKKPLITIATDFKKAFDSVKRNSLIECLKGSRIHPHITDVISEICLNDKTIMYLNNEIITSMNVTTGIRQGCNDSTALLLMITYLIILHLIKQKLDIETRYALFLLCSMQVMVSF